MILPPLFHQWHMVEILILNNHSSTIRLTAYILSHLAQSRQDEYYSLKVTNGMADYQSHQCQLRQQAYPKNVRDDHMLDLEQEKTRLSNTQNGFVQMMISLESSQSSY